MAAEPASAEEISEPNRSSRAELEAGVRERLQHGRWRDPDVLLIDGPGGLLVLKDFRPRAAWLRFTLGRFLIWRELRAYRVLQGHPAVPRLLGRLDAYALVLEYRPGRRMERGLRRSVSPGFVDALEKAVRGMHERGVAHLDLRHRSNVLVDEHGAPVLLDFASALCFRPGSLAARLVLPFLADVDLRAVAKWRDRLRPKSGDRASEAR